MGRKPLGRLHWRLVNVVDCHLSFKWSKFCWNLFKNLCVFCLVWCFCESSTSRKRNVVIYVSSCVTLRHKIRILSPSKFDYCLYNLLIVEHIYLLIFCAFQMAFSWFARAQFSCSNQKRNSARALPTGADNQRHCKLNTTRCSDLPIDSND